MRIVIAIWRRKRRTRAKASIYSMATSARVNSCPDTNLLAYAVIGKVQGDIVLSLEFHRAGGIETFRAHLGPIFLPPDPQQRPSPDFIRRANRFRRI